MLFGSPSILGIAEFIVPSGSFFHTQTHGSFQAIEELSPIVRMIHLAVGVDIHDHQASGVHLLHLLAPGGSLLLTAFTGTQRLFLRVQPMRLIASLIVEVLTSTPCVCSHSRH
jgi:hypothetical protein